MKNMRLTWDWWVFMKFLAIWPKMSPTSWNLMGNPAISHFHLNFWDMLLKYVNISVAANSTCTHAYTVTQKDRIYIHIYIFCIYIYIYIYIYSIKSISFAIWHILEIHLFKLFDFAFFCSFSHFLFLVVTSY